MEPTETPRTAARRPRRPADAPPSHAKVRLLLAGCAVVVLAAIGALYWFVLSDRAIHHGFEVDWPKDAPRGDPIRIRHEVKAGDVFVTALDFDSGLKLGFAQGDPRSGMKLFGKATIAQKVEAKPEGGLRSAVKLLLEMCDATYPPMKEMIWSELRDRTDPYALAFDRDPSGRPLRKTAGGPGATASRRLAVDTITGGLGDVVTNWLPDRDVRLGEAWDLEACATLPNVVAVVRHVSGSDVNPSGFPDAAFKGRATAEAVEKKNGEECLRVRIAALVTQEGDVKSPAVPGRITTAGRIQATAWVSIATGVVWAFEGESEMKSSYLIKDKAIERWAKEVVTAKTARADKMPE